MRKCIDETKKTRRQGYRRSRTDNGDSEVEKMESRVGGNVILQFILEEQLLPHLSDSYQLPPETERHREVKEGGEKDKLEVD